jgi:primosomal protein N' (replication factor Y)
LKCHYCGFQKKVADICQQCGGTAITYRGVGTQRVEEELKIHFPHINILRMDQDTTKRKGDHNRIVWQFEKGKYDVLMGTQMVAKGHDFPGVNLVGIISADTGIHFPDFRAGEKTFQLLTQAAGRAGRRNLQGEVIIQTRSPDHPILKFVINQDYTGFYQWESEQRKELNYPPWGRLILVRFVGPKEEDVSRAASVFPEIMPESSAYVRLGPVVSPISRLKRQYRYQIIYKGDKKRDPSGYQFKKNITDAINMTRKKSQFRNVRVIVDVDPLDMM